MKAIYYQNEEYPNNPFIEALPSLPDAQTLADALARKPHYDTDSRLLPSTQRLALCGKLFEVYQPLVMTYALYFQVRNAMVHSFANKQSVQDTQQTVQLYHALQNKRVCASTGGGNSFAVVGASGVGKSTAMQQVLAQFPQQIEHEHYHGYSFCCKQIPYLVVQTPHDASVKGLCLDIMLQIDDLLGTQYYKRALTSRATTDMLTSQLAQITRTVNLGLLVIDELQNISYSKSGGDVRFLNFIVQLINSAHLSTCLVGTPQVLDTLQREFRSARRATGFVYDRLPDAEEFSLLLNTMWAYQYVTNQSELTPEIRAWLYRKSQGVADIVVKLLYHAQMFAIISGSETLGIKELDAAWHGNMQMVQQFIKDMDDAPLNAKKVARKVPSVAHNSLNLPKGSANNQDKQDVYAMQQEALKNGISPVEALASYIQEITL
ncbi:MAG: ATP-binding protein [Ruthenibacterium sp.]